MGPSARMEPCLKRTGLVIVNSNGLPMILKVGIEPVNGVNVITLNPSEEL